MKIKLHSILIITLFVLCAGVVSDIAQAVPAYKISAVKIVPFDGQTGKFQKEITPKDERFFLNEISLSLFVTVEISGAAGSFEVGRMIDITVMEGKKQKAKKREQIGLIGEGGKFYIPVLLDSAFCDEVTVTARITGQKTASTMTRKVSFQCGE